MKTRSIKYNFISIEKFDLIKMKKVKQYLQPDSSYGEFIFNVKDMPKYYYNCIDDEGNTKKEIEDIDDIHSYVKGIINHQTKHEIDELGVVNLSFKRSKERNETLELLEIVDLCKPYSTDL